MPAAIAIPLIVGGIQAGASVYAAKKGADAAHDATAAQVASGDKAIALEQQQYANAQTALAPYQQFGINSLNSLGDLMGARPYQPFTPGASNAFTPPPAMPQRPPQYVQQPMPTRPMPMPGRGTLPGLPTALNQLMMPGS